MVNVIITGPLKPKTMIGTIFKKRPDPFEKGNGEQWQTWKVAVDLGDNVYSCVRVDSTNDPMGAASPIKRTFTKSKIEKYVLDNR